MHKREDREVNLYHDERDVRSVRERLLVYETYVNSAVEFVILDGANGSRKPPLC